VTPLISVSVPTMAPPCVQAVVSANGISHVGERRYRRFPASVCNRSVMVIEGAALKGPRFRASGDRDRPVVVAVFLVGVMQMAGDQEVTVVAVRHGLVTTARAVLVVVSVPAASVRWRAG
jgi:hypothetical protein